MLASWAVSEAYLNPLSVNPTKWLNTLKQFVGYSRRIVWVCLTILWGWRLKAYLFSQNLSSYLFDRILDTLLMSVGKNLSKIENEKVRNIYEAFSRSFLEVFHKKNILKKFFSCVYCTESPFFITPVESCFWSSLFKLIINYCYRWW